MKTKLFFFFVVLITSITFANAQESNLPTVKAKYQGEVFTGFGAGVGELAVDRIYIHTIQGVKIGHYFSTGLGIGINIVPFYVFGTDNEIYMPIYLNAKGYLPVSRKTSLFASLDLGGSFGLSEDVSDISGFLCTPAVGVSIVSRVNISLGYEMQKLSTNIFGLSLNMGAVAIKVGLRF